MASARARWQKSCPLRLQCSLPRSPRRNSSSPRSSALYYLHLPGGFHLCTRRSSFLARRGDMHPPPTSVATRRYPHPGLAECHQQMHSRSTPSSALVLGLYGTVEGVPRRCNSTLLLALRITMEGCVQQPMRPESGRLSRAVYMYHPLNILI